MKRQARLSLAQQLASVPIRNRQVETRIADDGRGLEVTVTARRPLWFRILAVPLGLRRSRRYLLDDIGRRLFEAMDGQRTFEQLIDAFAAEHQLTFFEARAFLMNYLATLVKNGLVAVAVPASAGTDTAEPTRPAWGPSPRS